MRLWTTTYRPGEVEGEADGLVEGDTSEGSSLATWQGRLLLVVESRVVFVRRLAGGDTVGLLELLLEHPLVVDVGRMLALAALARGQLLLLLESLEAGAIVRRLLEAGEAVQVLEGLIRLHHLGAQLAEGALGWVNLGLVVLNTNSND